MLVFFSFFPRTTQPTCHIHFFSNVGEERLRRSHQFLYPWPSVYWAWSCYQPTSCQVDFPLVNGPWRVAASTAAPCFLFLQPLYASCTAAACPPHYEASLLGVSCQCLSTYASPYMASLIWFSQTVLLILADSFSSVFRCAIGGRNNRNPLALPNSMRLLKG